MGPHPRRPWHPGQAARPSSRSSSHTHIHTHTRTHTHTPPGGSAIKSLVISRDRKQFLANSADRVIRAYNLERLQAGEKTAPRELQDVVNRTPWSHAAFSSESEHVVGTASSATDHLIYIWDMHGHLINILGQGDARSKVKDGAMHFACHPTRPILAVATRSGAVYVWTKRFSENWSAFAPDFKELEENEEYEEKEDEFDIKATADLEDKDGDKEDELIDITTVHATDVDHVPDAEDDDTELLFLPVVPQADTPGGNTGAAAAPMASSNGLGLGAEGAGGDEGGDDESAGKGGKARMGKRKAPGM